MHLLPLLSVAQTRSFPWQTASEKFKHWGFTANFSLRTVSSQSLCLSIPFLSWCEPTRNDLCYIASVALQIKQWYFGSMKVLRFVINFISLVSSIYSLLNNLTSNVFDSTPRNSEITGVKIYWSKYQELVNKYWFRYKKTGKFKHLAFEKL